MNHIPNPNALTVEDHKPFCYCKPIPALALYVLVTLFFIALGVSIFFFVVVHNAALLVSVLCLSALVATFLLWNSLNSPPNRALLHFLRSFPDSDLTIAGHGQLVKITGPVSCGNFSLESSYEKVGQCIYTSTLLYEFGDLGLKPADVRESCFGWRLTFSERFSTDFFITDKKSGIQALVKAGPNCKVVPLISESSLVKTTRKCKVLSSHLRKWLRNRNLSSEARLLCLKEGYIKEGSSVSVIGFLQRNSDVMTIVQPQDPISTGCLWQKLLLPVDVDGLILGPA